MASLMVVTLLGIAAVFYRQKKWLVLGLGATLIILTLSPTLIDQLGKRFSRLENIEDQNRVIMVIESARIIAEHPILGTGPGTFARLMKQTGLFENAPEGKAAHNNYLFLSVQYGITASVIFAFIFLRYFMHFWKGMKALSWKRDYFFAGVLLSIAFQGGGMTATVMGYNYFFYLLGLLYAVFRLDDQPQDILQSSTTSDIPPSAVASQATT
jgi:O-antigen ligase